MIELSFMVCLVVFVKVHTIFHIYKCILSWGQHVWERETHWAQSLNFRVSFWMWFEWNQDSKKQKPNNVAHNNNINVERWIMHSKLILVDCSNGRIYCLLMVLMLENDQTVNFHSLMYDNHLKQMVGSLIMIISCGVLLGVVCASCVYLWYVCRGECVNEIKWMRVGERSQTECVNQLSCAHERNCMIERKILTIDLNANS